ncbi:zinc-ribbon domain-containing protein [Methanomassiliicoccus luminyensis]|uniref:zinc-ribbon domain-containing protein n=1 Tax=Methanomassiliicoccus luminyensis TaxID=1080712 RepID=UPI000365BF56|nr:zinc-ribbon domain-containing protein [Methanomassiliicoccus luminyensis]
MVVPVRMYKQCPSCQATVPATSKFCPACGTLVNAQAPPDPVAAVKESADTRSMLCAMFGGMLLFFSFGFLLPGVLAEPGFLIVSGILALAGTILILMWYAIRKRSRVKIEELKISMRVQCEYCNGSNPKEAHKCAFCGAPLW